MNKIIIFILFVSTSIYAGTYRLVEYTTPQRSGTEIHYYLDNGELYTIEEYYDEVREGYEPDERFLVAITNVQTVEIPQPIQNVANAYKTTLENIYGEGAATNTSLTLEAVMIDLSLREDVTAEVGLRLSTWFEILNKYWARGEVWSFPYEQETYIKTTIEKEWKVIEQ